MQFKSQDLCLTFIQILHHLYSSPKILVSPPSKHHLNYKYSHLTFTLATSIQVPIFTPHHNAGHVSPHFRSWYLHLTSIRVTSHLHSCPENAAQLHPGPISNWYWSASSPSKSCLTCIQVKKFLYHRDPCTVSPPPKSHITFCQFTRCAAQVHQCPVSTPSKAPGFAP